MIKKYKANFREKLRRVMEKRLGDSNKIVRLLTRISAARAVNDKLAKLGIVKTEGKGQGPYCDLT